MQKLNFIVTMDLGGAEGASQSHSFILVFLFLKKSCNQNQLTPKMFIIQCSCGV